MTQIFQSKRFKWMVDIIHDSLDIKSKQFSVEDLLKSDKFVDKVRDFFEGKGPNRLLFYYQSGEHGGRDEPVLTENNFFLTTGEDEALNSKAIFFLRLVEGRPVNANDLDSDIIFGEMSPQTLQQLSMMLSSVFQPMIEHMDTKDWGECDQEQREEFTNITVGFANEIENDLSSLDTNGERCRVDPATVESLHNDQERTLYFEDLFEDWLKHFKEKFQKDEVEQKKTLNDGPRSELVYWRRMLQETTLLIELSRSKDFQTVKSTLAGLPKKADDRKSRLLAEFKVVENTLTEKLNEAKDNVKYLSTLEKLIEPLYSGSIEEIVETLPGLMNAIKMIHTISRYYNTSGKLTLLFSKITNQMIGNCRARISGDPKNDNIWAIPSEKLIDSFNDCINLCQKYKSHYEATKRKAAELPKSRHWDFDEAVIFGKFDAFVKRIKKLIELFSTIQQFYSLEKHSNLVGIGELLAKFRGILDEFKKKSPNLLDFENIKLEKDYVELMQKIQKLDNDLQVFIDNNFAKLRNISYSLRLLKKFENILKRDNVRNKLTNKYETILQNFGTEIDTIQKLFDEKKGSPPILRNMPPDAGKIIWVRHLFAKLSEPVNEFPPNLINSKEMKKYIDKYNLIGQNLIIYELYFTQSWCNDIDRAKSCLQTTLLVMKEENGIKKLKVNFERDIQKLLREAKALDREGIGGIPESAKIILLQEEKFKRYYYQLDFVRSEYKRITGSIKPIMRNLLVPHIEDMDLKLRPGMVTLTWTSMNIDSFIDRAQKGLQRLEQLVHAVNDIIENRIENNIRMIGNVVLVKLPDDSKAMSLEEFVDTQQTHIVERAELLISKNLEIERSVDDLLTCVAQYPLDSNIEDIDMQAIKVVKQYYFWYFYQALLNATQTSLDMMKGRICGVKGLSGSSFFEVNLVLEEEEIRMVPSLDDIQRAINRAATAVLSCSKRMDGWGQVNEDDSRESYYRIIAQDKEVFKVILLLTGAIQGTKNKIFEYLALFKKYEWLWRDNIDEAIRTFKARNPELREYEEELRRFTALESEIELIEKNREISAISIKNEELIRTLKAKCREWKNHYAEDLHVKAKETLTLLTENMKNYATWISKEVKEIDSLGQVMTTLEAIHQEQSEIELRFAPIFDMYGLLDNYLPGGITDKEEMDNRQLLKKKWTDIIEMADGKQRELQKDQAKNLKKLKENIRTLVQDVKVLRKNFEEEGPMVQGISPKEASDRLKRFENEYELKKAYFEINKRGEDLFGLQNQKYPELEMTHDQIQNLNKLYALYNQVNETTSAWEEEAWSEIQVSQIKDWEEQVLKYSDLCNRLPKPLREWQAYKDLKDKIENYKNIFPYIKELKDSMIKNRHWEKIIEVTGKQLNFQQPENFYFRELVEANLMNCLEDVEDIIDSAKKQDKIEKTKNEIKYDWNKREFTFKDWGSKRKIQILSGGCIEEIQEKLDEDIATLSGLGAMRHVGPFKEEVQSLQEMLIDIQATLDLWVKVQILWTSLERVFTEGDISVILTNESKKFAKIDKAWVKTIMEKAVEQKLLKLCCQNEIIKSILPGLQEELESCQKQLEKYLEMKRKSFPRFYFVSNQVLLKFLSQGSDPESIQEDFDKLFDAISKVKFDAPHKKNNVKTITEIINVLNSDTEDVPLSAPVVCADFIEKWLQNLEKSMQVTIKDVIRQATLKFLPLNAKELTMPVLKAFINEFPAQVVLIALQLKWTRLVQDALEKKASERNKAVNEAKHEINMILDYLTDMSKTNIEKSSDRQKLETLVTIQVYLKEVTTAWRFRDANDFEWQKYTRFYFNTDKDTCNINITDWEAEYSYEYLGVKERLCVTPLTDRCYISLAQAMSMYYGGAPAGPAGTGKTETVKDLGRTLGIFVVVTNCSSEHRYTDMAKIFKGLCQSGLWGCFDEFNRIDLEVLSVVAMQVESITSAKKEKKSEFSFPDETENIHLIPTCGYFITMNPGYAGRQELPENLKVLFRGVTMMVPDREVIIKVKLASCGYKEYAELAKKFKVLYGLCEEQLSKQKHYDFGLRNILSVLRTAGNILREEVGVPNEELIMMRTLRDMNLSKLVAEDVPLFNALMRDIFRIENPGKKTYPEVEKKIAERVSSAGLELYEPWVLKVIQLYETSLVRHGFMLVGPSCSGKSTIINILTEVLTNLGDGRKYVIQRMNPKAFTSQEMYGVKNFAGEWTPGIFSEMWRKANEKKPNKPTYWLVCDGPVDAIWIENLNTVLDDNKVLTLANGDRIFMLDSVKMVFEVENLNNASPATVSRCGQIYVSPSDLGAEQIMRGWIKQRTKQEVGKDTSLISMKHSIEKYFNKEDGERVLNILLKYFRDLNVVDEFEKKAAKNRVIDIELSLKTLQVLKIFGGLLSGLQGSKNSNKVVSAQDFEKMILFAIMWGVAGSYELRERLEFQEGLRALKDEKLPLPKVTDTDTIFDYNLVVDDKGLDWRVIHPETWKVPKKIFFSRLLMPTIDSARAEFLIDTLANAGQYVLLIGGAGTAKTSSILMYANKFDKDKFMLHRINFSSATQPVHFQTSIESVCDTKVRKGFGPKDGKLMTVFIDDLSMPEKNKWGDQITLEIVRELVEDCGFYRLEKNERGNFKFIENLRYIAAMNQPGGGRNDIPNRLKHHFVIFNMILPTRIDIIYDPILKNIFKPNSFPNEVNRVVDSLCTATLRIFNQVKSALLPTPSKFHYLFNLRDVSRIFRGMCQVKPETINGCNALPAGSLKPDSFLVALWRHECERVFIDKLTNAKDKNLISGMIKDICTEVFSFVETDFDKFFGTNYLFCDFLQAPTSEEEALDNPVEPTYECIENVEALREKCNKLLKKFNEDNPQKQMDLVLFDDALFHLLKISRMIKMPRSSALLVGVGGSGKQSLTRFAARVGGQQLFQIQLTKTYNENNLKEDLKGLFDIAGHKGQPITFILTDAEVKNEEFLEYINMVLSTGEVPGIIQKDEKEVWLGDVRTDYVKNNKDVKEPTTFEVYEYFLNRLRDNLHVVLCFSPVGNKFRERARKFPALFNECSIDWFLPWPEEALSSVAQNFLANFSQLEAKEEVRLQLPKWMAQVHIKINGICDEYYSKMRRSVFVTPKSYLSFIKAYQSLYTKKFEELDLSESNFKIGLQKIKEAKADIEVLEKSLKEEEEKVRVKKEVVEKIIAELNVERDKASQKNDEVSTEKRKIEVEKAKIEKDKELCERELKESLPALEKAQQAAAQVSSKELSDLKPILMQNAHIVMKYVVDAIQVVLYQKVRNDIIMLDKPMFASKKQEKNSLIEFFQDSWDLYGKQAFFDPGLAEKLQMMAKTENENLINGEILELLEPYTRCVPTWLSKEYAMNAFNKMGLIHDWMVQIEKFSIETRNIKPKRIALKQAENKLNVAAEKLAEAEKQLEEIQKKCEQLDNVFRVNNDEKNELEEQARKQKKKIDQANRLINSLSEERERWNKGANELAEFKRRLVGNVGLSTAFISYCGPFNAEFRDLIANQRLIGELKSMGIPHSPTIYADLTNFLVDEATVGQWNLDGLPKDVLSIQNGIMVESSERYPLLIDPQNQGTVWIKNKYKDINPETGRPYIFVVNINEEKKFRDGLVKCVENGEVLILEGIEGEVDPILDTVLEKQVIKKGRTLKISIGGVVTDFHKKFKLFLTCKLGNPKFSPELSAKTTIIDFTVTQNGLEQQLLSVVLSKKQRILEESLNALMKEVTMNKKELKKLDESLLQKLTSSSGNLLDDVELVEILNSTKTQAKEMQVKLADAEVKTNEINEKRCTFRPVAIRGSVLYFCMIEIAQVNWMYNSSLNQFLGLYNAAIDNSPKTTLPAKDVENILRDLTYMVYRYVNRGLFEVDKVTFLMMVCFKILITDRKLSSEDVSLFLKAGAAVDKSSMKPKPSAEWITDKVWMNIIAISNHKFAGHQEPFFKSFPDSIANNLDLWKKWAYEKNDPELHPVPEKEDNFRNEGEIGEFLRLVLVRSIREDRTITACAKFLQTTLGETRYTDPVSDTIESIHAQSSPREPVLFLLSAGADPTSSIDDLARKKKKPIWKVSLGEGQEKKAESLLNDSFEKGDWVLFQNCHLGLGFMSFLDTLISDEEWLAKAHPEFRLWMSCEPRAGFPLGLLQKAIKVTNEPPKGVKAGLFRTFTTVVNPEFLERIDHMNWRTLVYATCFLHSVVQERRKFGPLGWCIPYEYNYSDLEASLAFVEKYLVQLQAISTTTTSQNMNISYPVLIYMICQIQYGGRITDSLDRELFNSYGEMYYRETLLAPDALITRAGSDQKYIVPNALEHKTYLDYIDTLPAVDNPELFGLNSNADITFRLKETSEMIATIMETRPKDSGQSSGKSREEIIQARAKDLLTQVGFDFTEAEAKEAIKKLPGPKSLQDRGMTVPLNIFLFQEIQRMKRVVSLVKKTFSDIVESIDGQIIMTPEIVSAIDAIFDGKVPSFWIYDPSGVEISWLKPSFSLWFDSLLERCSQLTSWMKSDRPRSFNLGLFFNPQGFLTAMKQEVVRINKTTKTNNKSNVEWSMDNVEYQSSVLSEKQQKEFENGKDLSSEGVYIYGLFLEGCKWSKEGLQDSTEKKMVYSLNIMHVTAVSTNSRKGLDQEKKDSAYNCPVYKYPVRNDKYLIFRVLLPFAGLSGDQNKWKLRGVALLCSTD